MTTAPFRSSTTSADRWQLEPTHCQHSHRQQQQQQVQVLVLVVVAADAGRCRLSLVLLLLLLRVEALVGLQAARSTAR